MTDFMEDKRAHIGYYRFQFDCGCELLTRGEFFISDATVSCPFHQNPHFVVFTLDEDRYWVPLTGNSATGLVRDIPLSRGVRPEDRNFREKWSEIIDAQEIAEEAARTRWRRISRTAQEILWLENPDTTDAPALPPLTRLRPSAKHPIARSTPFLRLPQLPQSLQALGHRLM